MDLLGKLIEGQWVSNRSSCGSGSPPGTEPLSLFLDLKIEKKFFFSTEVSKKCCNQASSKVMVSGDLG